MNRIPRQGEIYRHFKNKLYQIVAIANHSETGEQLVIYQALYGTYKVYARPLEMFISRVDREKYPDAKQEYRFVRVEESELLGTTNVVQEAVLAAEHETHAQEVLDCTDELGTADGISEKMMAFFDAKTMEEKYNILVSMRDEVTDGMIDNMAVVVDVVIPEGDIRRRYDELKNAIRTRQKYEYANRLR